MAQIISHVKKKISLREPFQTMVFSVVLLYSGACDHMNCVCVFVSELFWLSEADLETFQYFKCFYDFFEGEGVMQMGSFQSVICFFCHGASFTQLVLLPIFIQSAVEKVI